MGQGEEVTHDTYQVDDFVKYTTFYAVILQNIKISLCKGKRVVTNSNFHVTSF